jgi:hypothetical protein
MNPILIRGAIAHVVVAIFCVGALFFESSPILGVHPALKPLKFGISIAVFLATLAILLPKVSIKASVRDVFAWLFVGTMVLEMIPILVQPLRGTTSHFNISGNLNHFFWLLMMGAIVVATLGMMALAWLASVRPLTDGSKPLHPWLAFAWRASLWMFAIAAVSGFAMGARLSHSVGGVDGGPGLPFVNWSVTHGDLRIPHFFALHAMQVLPLVAMFAIRFLPRGIFGWSAVVSFASLYGGFTLITLIRALSGRAL